MERSRSSSADDGEVDAPDPVEELRARVEEKYDFDDFRPRDMAEMSPEEWDAVFDPETWITGPELLDRVEDDLRTRIAYREVFAMVERQRPGEFEGPDADDGPRSDAAGGEPDAEAVDAEHTTDDAGRVLAYSDEGYAIVYPDGSVEGRGTILRDVKASVALCSMPDYEVPEPPADASLPNPEDVPEGSGDLANRLVQFIAGAQIVSALVLIVWGALFAPPSPEGQTNRVAAIIVGLLFLGFGVFLLFMVANARLSDRFRAEEYRERLRNIEAGLAPEERERPIEEVEARVIGESPEGLAPDEADDRPGRESAAE